MGGFQTPGGQHGGQRPSQAASAQARCSVHAPYPSCPCTTWRRAAGGSGAQAGAGQQGRSPPLGRSCSARASRRRPGHRWWSTVGREAVALAARQGGWATGCPGLFLYLLHSCATDPHPNPRPRRPRKKVKPQQQLSLLRGPRGGHPAVLTRPCLPEPLGEMCPSPATVRDGHRLGRLLPRQLRSQAPDRAGWSPRGQSGGQVQTTPGGASWPGQHRAWGHGGLPPTQLSGGPFAGSVQAQI